MFPVAVMAASPYSLLQSTPILPQIQFLNEVGWSSYSDVPVSPDLMEVAPHMPSTTPTSISALTFGT